MTEPVPTSTSRPGMWLVWSATIICGLAVAYNSGAVMASSPFMKADLDLDSATLQWVMVSYMLVATVLVGVMGGFADIFGRLRLLIFGAVLFASGSLVCLIADSGPLVIVGRSIQGIGGAAIYATGLAVLTVATPESLRTLALGLWSAAVALGLGIGPLVGGILTDLFDWRAIFAFDILLLAAGLAACARVSRAGLVPDEPTGRTKIDYVGATLMMVGLGSLTFALSRGQEDGWSSVETILLLVASVLAGIGFLVRERRADRPLFQLAFFRRRSYIVAASGTFVAGFGMFGLIYYYNLFVQAPGAFGYSALTAGVTLLPCTMLFFIGSIGFPRLLTRFNAHWPTTFGMILLAAGFWLLRDVTIQSGFADIWWKLALIGLGFGLTFGLLPRVGLRELPDTEAGQGSGVINTCLYVGFTFGIAAGGVVADSIRHGGVRSFVATLKSGPTNRDAAIHDLARGSGTQVERALSEFSAADAESIRLALKNLLDDSFDGTMTLLAAASLIGAAVCAWLLRGPRPEVSAE